jgi:hypothetical protein
MRHSSGKAGQGSRRGRGTAVCSRILGETALVRARGVERQRAENGESSKPDAVLERKIVPTNWKVLSRGRPSTANTLSPNTEILAPTVLGPTRRRLGFPMGRSG